MQRVTVDLGERSYDITIGSGILGGLGPALAGFGFSKRIGLVSNPTVYGLYGSTAYASLKEAGFDVSEIIIPDGEEYKSLAWVEKIYEGMLRAKLDRKSALVALGGGVIGDITGFAASTYMRGIDFIQVPTTLLAQVDSSVGGKTGVNHPLGKNMIGSFWQPRLVWLDIDTLRTLPRREFLSGMAEVIKYGVIWDDKFFLFLEQERDYVLGLEREAVTHVIRRSCEVKAEVVSRDERESGLRAILNYGHTIGHAIETVTGYTQYLHGEAVAIGMYLEAKLSCLLGFTGTEEVQRIQDIIGSYGLPTILPEGAYPDSLLQPMELDKKTEGGEMKFVLPEKIGAVRIQKGVSLEEIRKALKKD